MIFLDLIPTELLYKSISYFSPAALIAGLIFSWKNRNAQCLIGLLFVLEVIDTLLLDTVWEWGNNYYIWMFLYCTLYVYVVLFRRAIAKTLSPISSYFRYVYENYHFTKHEGLLLLIYIICLLAALTSLIEIKLYQYKFIESWTFTKYALGSILIPATFIEGFLILKISLRKPLTLSVSKKTKTQTEVTNFMDKR